MTITFKIDNPDVEKQLKEFVKEQKEITLDAFKKFIDSFQKKDTLVYKKRDIRKHISVIQNDDNEPRDGSIALYSHVEDSGEYIHNLRRVRNR